MCVVSFVGDYARQTIPPRYPWVEPYIETWQPNRTIGWPALNAPTKEEFDALKREMEELRELLKAANKYDEATGQAECETADKVAVLKKLAELVGVDLEDVLHTGGK